MGIIISVEASGLHEVEAARAREKEMVSNDKVVRDSETSFRSNDKECEAWSTSILAFNRTRCCQSGLTILCGNLMIAIL